MFQSKCQVRAVLWRQRRNAQFQSGQVDAFMLAECAAVHHFANHLPVAHLLDAQLDQSVREQNAVTAVHLTRQCRERGAHARGIAQHFGGGNNELLAGPQHHRPATRERSGANFRPLQIRQNRNRFFMFPGGGANHREILRVLLVRAVREIQARHVHPGREKLVDHPR